VSLSCFWVGDCAVCCTRRAGGLSGSLEVVRGAFGAGWSKSGCYGRGLLLATFSDRGEPARRARSRTAVDPLLDSRQETVLDQEYSTIGPSAGAFT